MGLKRQQRTQQRNRITVVMALFVIAMLTAACTSFAAPRPLVPCAPAAVKPTVVLVHGAWADTSSWNGEVGALQQAGYVARAIGNPLRDLTGDAATVSDFLKTIPGPVVLVGHSYGGSVITNASVGNPNVKALVYVDAAAPDVGETTGQLSGSDSALNANPADLYDMVAYAGAPAAAMDLYLKQQVFVGSFGSDLPQDVANRLWASQRAASNSAFMTPSKEAGWKTIPSWYFISTGDRIITLSSERSMAQRARSNITEFPGGSHLTLISNPDAVTAVIGNAICAVR
ncbi:alpha/beta hydrolase [Saccharopolyspora sp. K220]|uniref:alpha/beta hydrolase n=1 Tax=Saccharopolyspora soli TaxID=2926618 RepID=UPI001F57FA6C|nr:alpha/beta hydrolase [Saccharopolyspora soli]MCI2421919.1 alpha/beta hydrolase [Saccharopolyspora soli]